MKYTCFAFLQRWPTSRTQKDSFNTEGLTCDQSYSTAFTPQPPSVPHMHSGAWLCAHSEQRTTPMKFLHVCSVIGFIMETPLQTVEASTSLTAIWTQTVIKKKKISFLLVFVGTLVHFRSLSHTYRERSALSFPDTSLSKASPALVNWAAPSSFSLE